MDYHKLIKDLTEKLEEEKQKLFNNIIVHPLNKNSNWRVVFVNANEETFVCCNPQLITRRNSMVYVIEQSVVILSHINITKKTKIIFCREDEKMIMCLILETKRLNNDGMYIVFCPVDFTKWIVDSDGLVLSSKDIFKKDPPSNMISGNSKPKIIELK